MAEIGAESQPDMSKKYCRYHNLFVSVSVGYVEGTHGIVVVKALCYKSEGRGFGTQ
jgi:hypothetical protein